MMHKQHAITLFRPWPQTGSFGSHLREIIAKLRNSFQIPTGYQDETGFHAEVKPAGKGIH
jgi:hypothetical protein